MARSSFPAFEWSLLLLSQELGLPQSHEGIEVLKLPKADMASRLVEVIEASRALEHTKALVSGVNAGLLDGIAVADVGCRR